MLHASYPFDPSVSPSHHKKFWLRQSTNNQEDQFKQQRELLFFPSGVNFYPELQQAVPSDIMQSFDYSPFSHSSTEANLSWRMPKAPTNVASAVEYLLPKHTALNTTQLSAKSPVTEGPSLHRGQPNAPAFLLSRDCNHSMPSAPKKVAGLYMPGSSGGLESRGAGQSPLSRGWGTVGSRGSGAPLHLSSQTCESKSIRNSNLKDVDVLVRATSLSAESQITEQAAPGTPGSVVRPRRGLSKQQSTVTNEITRELSESPGAARTSGMQCIRLQAAAPGASPLQLPCGVSPGPTTSADSDNADASNFSKDQQSSPRASLHTVMGFSLKSSDDGAEHLPCKSEEEEEGEDGVAEAAAATEDFTDEEDVAAGRSPKSCAVCRTTKTPLWRNGPPGPKSLCNACGIRFNKIKAGKRKATALEASYLAAYMSQEAVLSIAPSSPIPQQKRKVSATKQLEHVLQRKATATPRHMQAAKSPSRSSMSPRLRKRSRRADGDCAGSGSEGGEKEGAGSSGTSFVSAKPNCKLPGSAAVTAAAGMASEEEEGAMLLMALFYGGSTAAR